MSSGVKLPEAVGDELESLVFGASPKPLNEEQTSNPDWERDELIVALDFYLQHRPSPPSKNSQQIREGGLDIKPSRHASISSES